jgi:hypothetical protein
MQKAKRLESNMTLFIDDVSARSDGIAVITSYLKHHSDAA